MVWLLLVYSFDLVKGVPHLLRSLLLYYVMSGDELGEEILQEASPLGYLAPLEGDDLVTEVQDRDLSGELCVDPEKW